uniref:Heat shock protein DnaJ domain-containing protein (DnaJ) n=1 Tax=uncultured marine thaumarchaeote KM3_04_D06 TaxID=1455965 RepID=A0A075G3D3_9ARCH|nr:heat shock protein DnaJ domain-containing protein (dnaJ) [uncultured marine thaumarchaeote KM3_04_D06]
MRHKFCLYFLIPFLLFLPLDALADSVNISVDLPIYTNADVVTIYGNISNETLFQVTITSPEKIVVADEEIVITAGDFTHNVILGNYEMDKNGTYNISVSYGSSVVENEFFYHTGQNVNPVDVSNRNYGFSEDDQVIIFSIAAVVIVGVLVFLARGTIFRKKTEYDKGDWASKKNRDYEKYHSEWMSDEIKPGRKEKTKFSDEEFRKSLLEDNVPDYYAILEVQKTANQSEIKNQFRALAKKWHPDKKQDEYAEKKMAQINMAYEVLSNPKHRKMYDLYYHKK